MAILDLIEYIDSRPDEIVHRIPEYGSGEFRLGSQCVVRESQQTVFVRDGKALDILPPGRHTLTTANIPLLTGIIGLPFGSKSPFRAEVYYVMMREFTGLKWGTTQPVVFRDSEFGMIRIRAFGTYSMQVKDPQVFVNQIVGTQSTYSTSDIENYLRTIIINEFNDMMGETLTTLLDVQAKTVDLATAALHSLTDNFERIGLEIRSFQIGAITPPDEVQTAIDQRSAMGAIGNMQTYTQYQAAQAIGGLGQGGEGGQGSNLAEGAGLGAGIGIGAAMADALRQSMAGGQQPAQQAQAGGQRFCPNCGNPVPAGAKFCPSCGHNVSATAACPKCATENPTGSKFCQNCGTALGTT
ncbi:MAG TPA: SPFH domain-containing protein [Thermomicrobiales bacterium]|nr:SPFH domain-containing protein [Thermomicrobiales bacterium]HQZ89739.1 SPFH domain-containing protein [Thermomicrobiales bacterium]HRA31861.1 SPFH domain-containing protein [Thermomicrobiales bacterium]